MTCQSSDVATDFLPGGGDAGSGLTVSQGNPYPKLKSCRISPSILLANTKQDFNIFIYLPNLYFNFRAQKWRGRPPPGFHKCGGQDPCDPPPPGGDAPGSASLRPIRAPVMDSAPCRAAAPAQPPNGAQ